MKARLPSQLVTIENRSSVLSPHELFELVWGVAYQVAYHYDRSPWVTHRLAPAAHVVPLPVGARPPVGAWNIVLLDYSPEAGALGFHEDEKGNEIPFSDVFCATAIEDGAAPSEVASHEVIEMLVDPHVLAPRVVTHDGYQWIVEACDPVQGCGYDVGAPDGRITGVTVADFALPAWWGVLDGKVHGFSFRRSVSGAFQLAPQGYISKAPLGTQNWTQQFGERKNVLPAWASRLPRIHAD